jgi:Ser/Thr protein kinase RdoA (MazF antagonist)
VTTLQPGGDRARYRGLAEGALARWAATPDAQLEFVRHGENLTFRVTDGGRSFALRIARPGYHTLAAIHSEISWMAALRTGGIQTPEAVPGRDGEIVQQFTHEGRGQVAVAFEWVDGIPLPESNATDPWEELGAIMARVHRHGREWTPPPGFERPAWDLEALVGDDARWGDACPASEWSAPDRAVLLEARAAVRARLRELGNAPDRFGLVHSDLGFENVLVTPDGGTILIDFDDFGASWYLYEIASALYPLENDPRFAEFRDALVAGYRREGQLPDDLLAELPTFLMARRFATLGWTFTRADTEHAQRQRPTRLRTSPRAAREFLEWDARSGRPVA